jgi:hypothetical protein
MGWDRDFAISTADRIWQEIEDLSAKAGIDPEP